MACEPFDCEKCGQRHERCTGHVDSDEEGNRIPLRPCIKWPRKGSPVCMSHGGNAPQVRKAAERRLLDESARRECDRLGILVEIDPAEALITAVWRAQGNLAYYEAQVAQLSSPITTETGPGGAFKEAPHPLIVLYHEAEKWAANVAVSALRAGVEERRVRMAERDATQIIQAQVDALIAMGLGDRLDDFRAEFLAAIDRRAGSAASSGDSPAALA